MARTKQTAKRSTGSRAPRKQVRRTHAQLDSPRGIPVCCPASDQGRTSSMPQRRRETADALQTWDRCAPRDTKVGVSRKNWSREAPRINQRDCIGTREVPTCLSRKCHFGDWSRRLVTTPLRFHHKLPLCRFFSPRSHKTPPGPTNTFVSKATPFCVCKRCASPAYSHLTALFCCLVY